MLSLTDRQQRWLTAVLVLGTIVLGMVAIEQAATVFFAFGDIILVFFLAWLLAFILSPVVAGLTRLVPVLPRIGAVVLVYITLVGAIVLIVVLIANALAQSITSFVAGVPSLRDNLPTLLAPWQDWLKSLGFDQVEPRRPGGELPRQPRVLRDPAGRPPPAARGREHRRAGQPAAGPDPVALHGRGPRPDHVLLLPDRAAGADGRGAAPRAQRRPVLRRLPPRPGDPGRRVRSGRGLHEHRPRAALRRDHERGRRRPDGDPVLRPVRRLGAAGDRRPSRRRASTGCRQRSSWASAG